MHLGEDEDSSNIGELIGGSAIIIRSQRHAIRAMLQIILAGLAFLTLRNSSEAEFVLVIDSGSTGTRM